MLHVTSSPEAASSSSAVASIRAASSESTKLYASETRSWLSFLRRVTCCGEGGWGPKPEQLLPASCGKGVKQTVTNNEQGVARNDSERRANLTQSSTRSSQQTDAWIDAHSEEVDSARR